MQHDMPSTEQRKDIIAFCGTRGVPANYGGFETAVDEISLRMAQAGYACEVFCRESSVGASEGEHQGRRLIYVKGSKHRKLDTVVSSIQTGRYLLRHRHAYKHVFWFNNANLPGILMTRLAGIPTSINTDGLEWRRAKWSLPFKIYYILCAAIICALFSRLISDSRAIQDYYRKKFRKRTQFIPYGHPSAIEPEGAVEEVLAQYGLETGKYFLQITRFEPDNLPLEIAQGFLSSTAQKSGMKLVVIGYKDETPYAMAIKALDGEVINVVPATYIPSVLQILRTHCFSYIHGNSVGGTNPALLEAMTSCPRVLAIASPFSSEVLGEEGYYFEPADLPAAINAVLEAPSRREALRNRVMSNYQWDAVAQSYTSLCEAGKADYSEHLRPLASENAGSVPRSGI
jgi:glycosyltransferase involved in cell wall biosynthesis